MLIKIYELYHTNLQKATNNVNI